MILKYLIGVFGLPNILGFFKFQLLRNIRIYLTDLNDNALSQLNIGYGSIKDASTKINHLVEIHRLFTPKSNLISCIVVCGIIQFFEYMSKCKIVVSHDVNNETSRISITYHFKSNTPIDEASKQRITKIFKETACGFWGIDGNHIFPNCDNEYWGTDDYAIYFKMTIIGLKYYETHGELSNICDQFCKSLNDAIIYSGLFSIPSFYGGCYGNCV